jgi:hypothetical protein
LVASWRNTQAETFVAIPGTVGNTDQFSPFEIEYLDVQSMRYQQVYASGQFSAAGLTDVYITDLYFQIGASTHGFGSVITNIQITLSTTTKSVDGLSAVFAENVGTNETVVHSGSLGVFQVLGSYLLDVPVILQTAFHYRPKDGNLLMDVRNFTGATPPPMQLANMRSANDPTDSVSSVVAPDVGAGSGTPNTVGLLTGFLIPLRPDIQSIVRANSTNLVLTWSSDVDRIYRLQSKPSLSITNWTDMSPDVTGGSPTTSFTTAISNVSQRYYRVVYLR